MVQDTGRIGLGLSAMEHIPKGARVIVFGGTILNWRQFAELPLVLREIPFQIDDDLLFGVTSTEDIGIGERINHSCDPNTGFVSEMKLVALRDIDPGEAITMDYATCISIDDYHLVCKCGTKKCRGVIRGSDWKDPSFTERMFNYLQPYLRKKVTERNGPQRISRHIWKHLTQLTRR